MAAESILVVDDVPLNLKLTGILLQREGFQVHTTPDAEHALSLLRGFHPDLMLVDIELPGMDGLTLTRQVKQNPTTRDIVVVAVSGHASDGDNRQALEAGCDGYLSKPVDPTILVSSIRDYLQHHTRTSKTPPPERHAPATAAKPVAGAEDLDVETLQRQFLEEGALRCRYMLDSLEHDFDAQKAARLFHQWVGAAGMLGYMAISGLAREAETAVSKGTVDFPRLRDLLSNLIVQFAKPEKTA